MTTPSEWWEKNKIEVFFVGALILAAILFFAVLSVRSCTKPVDTVAMLEAAKIEAQKPLLATIAQKEAAVKDYQSRLIVSQNKVAMWADRYAALQQEKENVKPPTTNAELRDRFTALGFPPLEAVR